MSVAATPVSLRAAIAALIGTVANTGQIHARRRVVRSENDLRRFFWDDTNSRICGWMIAPALSGTADSVRNTGFSGYGLKGGGNVMTDFAFQVEGIFGLDDANASEEVFGDLVWAVADEFNSYGVIPKAGGGVLPGVTIQGPCNITQFGYITFANTFLCHYARLELTFNGRTRG